MVERIRSNNRGMRLLIITQAVDMDHPVLGFFHAWIAEFAKRCEGVEVICLFEGRHELPKNVRVYSLGKEKGAVSRLRYALRFLRRIVALRKQYDVVFVHMNPEYVLLGGFLWKLTRKPVCLWRNHYQKHWAVPVAGLFCKKVFSTSRYSYAAGLPNAVLMPVGVDAARFPFASGEGRETGSILFLARMAPSKRPHLLLDALALLAERGVACRATFVGNPLPKDASYYESLRARAELLKGSARAVFIPGVPNTETSALYRTHDIFVNASPSGMYDKTMFEAMASGALIVAANKDLKELIDPRFIFEEESAESLADRLAWALSLSSEEKNQFRTHNRTVAEAQSLSTLVPKILEVYEA